MFRHVPNALTILRLLLAVVFFVMLSFYQYEGRGDPTFLNVALVIYIVAVFTDFLDGYLARRWRVEGRFGRIVDPFVDKILVLGSFVFFAGKNFIIPVGAPHVAVVKTITGVAPWMVVVLLGRELLVTSLRGLSESGGRKFGAVWSGKMKMGVQSVTIFIILLYVNYLPHLLHAGWQPPARMLRDIAIWATILVTIWSGWGYVRMAMGEKGGKNP